MGEREFTTLVRDLVSMYANEHLDKADGRTVTPEDIYIVFQSKVLQNNKATAITALFNGMYYEITYNGNKQEAYIDVYKKLDNRAYRVYEKEEQENADEE